MFARFGCENMLHVCPASFIDYPFLATGARRNGFAVFLMTHVAILVAA